MKREKSNLVTGPEHFKHLKTVKFKNTTATGTKFPKKGVNLHREK